MVKTRHIVETWNLVGEAVGRAIGAVNQKNKPRKKCHTKISKGKQKPFSHTLKAQAARVTGPVEGSAGVEISTSNPNSALQIN